MNHPQEELIDWSVGWYCIRTKPRMETVAAATLGTLEDVGGLFTANHSTAESEGLFGKSSFPRLSLCPV